VGHRGRVSRYALRVARLLIHLIIAVVTSKRAVINATYPHLSISALPTAQAIFSSFSDLHWLQRRIRLLRKTSTFARVLQLDFSPFRVQLPRRHWI